jgi:hypothetical protein
MAKLLYSATKPLDGFIAGPGGGMFWLTPHLGPNPHVDALQRDIGALLIGNRAFRGDDSNPRYRHKRVRSAAHGAGRRSC